MPHSILYNMQKHCLDDNCYNITKQLSNKLEFLSHVDEYIKDAIRTGDTEAEKTWRSIQTDEQKHVFMLHDLVISEVKNNRF